MTATNFSLWTQLTPGTSGRGWWQPQPTTLPALPVLAARGTADGPTVLISGGVHGDEYEAPAAIHTFFDALDPGQLAGTVVGLPVVNMAAWLARSRTAPVDGVDLNRVFPGDPAAAEPSRQLAAAVFAAFVEPCDVLIDLHSGGARLQHTPMVGWYAGDERGEALARRFGGGLMPWLLPDVTGNFSCEARRAGKIALGAEYSGGAGLDRSGVQAYAEGIRRLLAMLQDGVDTFAPDIRRPITGSYQPVEVGGLFVAAARLGDAVTPSSILGRVYNLLGEVVGEVRPARAGIVAALAHWAWLEVGDRVAYVG